MLSYLPNSNAMHFLPTDIQQHIRQFANIVNIEIKENSAIQKKGTFVF